LGAAVPRLPALAGSFGTAWSSVMLRGCGYLAGLSAAGLKMSFSSYIFYCGTMLFEVLEGLCKNSMERPHTLEPWVTKPNFKS